MVNVQEVLNKKYPDKDQVGKVYLSNLDFEEPSELIIDNYSNLKRISGYDVFNLTKLTVSNCPKLEEINISWFKNNYQLILHSLPSLKELACSKNKLTALDLSSCSSLRWAYCSYNQLEEIKLPKGKKLERLNLSNNNFRQDLSLLKDLVNLKSLELANNNFYGSLEFLKDLSKLEKLDISDTNIDNGLEHLSDSLKNFDCSTYKEDAKVKVISNLVPLKDYKQWRKLNFTEEEVKAWIKAGAKIDDCGFIIWLRDTKSYTPNWVVNYKEDYQILNERFKKYGLCQKCNEPNTGNRWCQFCNASFLRKMFTKWTSNNQEVDQFIQKYQLEATDKDKFIEWIPYKQFKDVKYLTEGGFGKVYRARWIEGNVDYWDTKKKQWQREKDHYYEDKEKDELDYELNKEKYKKYKNCREVVLKSLNNSSENTGFLQETEKHKIIDDWFKNIIPCYGISQDPENKNYLMVMQYMPEGNLRHYLDNLRKNNKELKTKLVQEKKFEQEIEKIRSNKEHLQNQEILQKKQQKLDKLHLEIVNLQAKLTLQNKLSQLLHIAQGLKDIHQKNLIHRDFHSGNILKGIEQTSCLITDLGLCKPANETRKEDKIFGVMPYVAPEVLQSWPYTQASDIYSWGMVVYEMLSGLPPYYDRAHDLNLALSICQGLRPQFQIKISALLENLIKKCWDSDPNQRPTSNELERTLRGWETDSEFKNQLQEAEEFNKALPDEIKFPDYQKKMHMKAIYHSKLLPTKEITQLLQNYHLQNKTLELNKQLTEVKKVSEKINASKNSSQESLSDSLVKAFNFLLEKSQELTNELEKIIATNPFNEEAKKALKGVKDLKTKLIELEKEDDKKQKLEEAKIQKEKELEELKNIIIANSKLDEDAQLDLDTFLKNKKEATKNNNDKRVLRELEKSQKGLKDLGVAEEEIKKLCHLQKEITELEIKLQQNVNQKTQQLTQIINNIGFTMGDNNKVGNVSVDGVINYQEEIITTRIRKLSIVSQTTTANQKKTKQLRTVEEGQQSEPMKMNHTINDWTNINSNFNPELIQSWQKHNFTPQQTQDWINIGLNPNDYNFAHFLKKQKNLTPEQILNNHNFEELKQEFLQSRPQPQIIQTNLSNFQSKYCCSTS